MQPSSNDQPVPRETPAGLQRGNTPPTSGTPARGGVSPASQSNLFDDRSSPDEFDPRKKSQSGKHVTADKWNQ